MGARTLTRWQKAGALVPMAVLVGAWGAALSNSTLASASDDTGSTPIPQVPATAFEQPASVQAAPAGIDEHAGLAGTVSTLSTNGIPSAALYAYRRAETLLGKADASCRLPWNLVAAIGRVESNHGRTNGNALDAEGLARPGIYGIPLDGRDGRAKISDTDGGALDRSAVYDRAVGPMQFIPGTWSAVGIDSDNDGKKNPQDIDDAATAAGIYLCAGSDDLSTERGAAAAVRRYNHSDAYVRLVLSISAKYAQGDFSPTPNGSGTAAILTSRSLDQTLTPAQRDRAADNERNAGAKRAKKKAPAEAPTSGGAGGTTTGTPAATPTGGGSGGSPGGGGSTGGGGGGGGGGGTVGGTVGDLTDDTPLAPVTKPVTETLTRVEANLQCTLKVPALPVTTYSARFAACMATFGY